MTAPSDAYWVSYAHSVFGAAVARAKERDRATDLLGALDDTADDADEVDAMLRSLSERTHVPVDASAFHEELGGDDPFTAVCVGARMEHEEAEVLAVLAAVEFDIGLQRVVAWLQDDLTRPHVSVGLVSKLFPSPHRGALAVGPGAALTRACLVDVDRTGPFATRRVVLDERVGWFLLGERTVDRRLPIRVTALGSADGSGADLVAVSGPDRTRRRQAAVAHARGDQFLVAQQPATDEEWAALIREASLGHAGIVIEVEDLLAPIAVKWIQRTTHLPWAISSEREQPLEVLPPGDVVEVTAAQPTLDDNEWRDLFGDHPREHQLTAEQVRLGLGTYFRSHDLDQTVRRLSVGPIDELATRIRPERSWSDLVLPADRAERLREIVDRHRHRSTVVEEWGMTAHTDVGQVALFHGPSGTGKTLAAEIIAHELCVDLIRIDLSTVVSKYIGETEKNLAKVFDAAASTSCVLLFDEADALFGKRSDVTDAKDRYANIEVSYLLQRLEGYDGITVLTTNLPQNLDQAFLRRIDMSVDFLLPDVDERRKLWSRMLDGGAPIESVDLDFLAERFELSGGSIRSCVYAGLSRAAAADTSVTTDDLVHGVRREYQKLGRLPAALDAAQD